MHRHLAFFFCLAALLCLARPAAAQSVSLSNLVVDNQEGRIKVRFGVDFKDIQAVKDALAEARPLLLDCRATLALKRDYAWNREVAKADLKSTLTLSDADGLYEVVLPAKRQERYRGRDAALVMKEAWGELTLDLGAWKLLDKGNDYALVLEIRLLRQNVPTWVKGTLFFWNFDAVPAGKYQLDFSY